MIATPRRRGNQPRGGAAANDFGRARDDLIEEVMIHSNWAEEGQFAAPA